MNTDLTSHQQQGHTETGSRFKISSERAKKRGWGGVGRGVNLATLELVVQRVSHYTIVAPYN